MKLLMVSIFDQAVGAYSPPFTARSKGEACRHFSDAVSDPQSNLNKHPQDFTLFAIGSFDDKLCLIETSPTPEKILTALECKTLEQSNSELAN